MSRDPWISLAQNHAYSAEHLDTSSYVRRQVTQHAAIEASQLQRASEAALAGILGAVRGGVE